MRVAARALSLFSLCALAACASPGDAPIEGLQPKLQACPGAASLLPDPQLSETLIVDATANLAEGRAINAQLQIKQGIKDRRAQRMAIGRVETSLRGPCPGVTRIHVRAVVGPKQAGFLDERVERSR